LLSERHRFKSFVSVHSGYKADHYNILTKVSVSLSLSLSPSAFFMLLRQGIAMYSTLAWNCLCCPDCPYTKDLPALDSQVLGLQVCTTTSSE
jgi:hypothetical protein